jgi:hypothetical protein
MKKMLTLMVILSVASLAGASLQISAGGNWNPADSEIYVLPSQTTTLGIWTDASIPAGISFALVCNTSGGTISVSNEGTEYVGPIKGTGGTDGDIMGFIYSPAVANGLPLPEGEDGAFGGIGVFAGTGIVYVEPGVLLFDNIVFHCEGPGDTVIKLYMLSNEDMSIIGTEDTVIVHQIPEPATIALLCLGGLLLRKKK